MSKVTKGINDLQTKNPDYIKEWDYEKNDTVTPSTVAYKSNKKVWWKCSNGHSWEASPDKRSRGDNCPFCSGKRILAGYNDLNTVHPELVKDWDYSKNIELSPTEIAPQSNKKVWWKCHACGFEWNVSPNVRYTCGCPRCSEAQRVKNFRNNYLKPGINDFESQCPKELEEWDFELNTGKNPTEYTINSKEKVWWKCKQCGHTWAATIKNRTVSKSGCPKCMRHEKTSFPEQAIFYYVQKIYPKTENSYSGIKENSSMELDIFIPEKNIGIEYDGKAWHDNKKSNKRDYEKYILCNQKGIKLVRVSEFQRTTAKDYDSIIIRDDLTDKGLNQSIINLLTLMECPESEIDVDVTRDRSVIMQQYITYISGKSIASNYPEEVKYWDVEKNGGLTADMVNATSNIKYWWKCDLGHSYDAPPMNRLGKGNECPYCSGHRILKGFNDLATTHPELMTEWDFEKNTDIKPDELSRGSVKNVWWICKNNHSYLVSPNKKLYNYHCPYCSNKKLLIGYNDFKTKYPDIALMWNYNENPYNPEDVIYISRDLVSWCCNNGHSYKRKISAQIKSCKCPICDDLELVVGVNDIKSKYPDIANEWDYTNNANSPADFTRTSQEKVWWICSICGYNWQAQIRTRISFGTGCPKCGYANKMQQTRKLNIIKNKLTLADKFPELLKEWDYERNDVKPDEISYGANKKIWWKCTNGHHYYAWLTDRTGKSKTGCPYCSGKRKFSKLEELN